MTGTSSSSPARSEAPHSVSTAGTPSEALRISILHQPLVVAGGAERQALEEARTLSALGHEVTVLTFELTEETLLAPDIVERIEVLAGGSVAARVASLRRAFRGAHLVAAHSSPELTWLATRGTGVPYVVYHNSPPYYRDMATNPVMSTSLYRRALAELNEAVAGYEGFRGSGRPSPGLRLAAEVRVRLKHRALRDARAVIVLSQRTRRELRALHGVDSIVIRGCLPAVILDNPPRHDSDSSSTAARGARILSVSRLEGIKRIDLLIRAFARALDAIPGSELVVVGDGPERERLIALSEALGVSKRVRFTGFVRDDEIWSQYAAADVFAAPTVADFNIAPYEALAMDCKVVWATAMETDPEIEVSGRVFSAEPDERSFAQALIEAWRGPAGHRPELREMTWEARARRVDRLYRECARGADS